MKAAEIKLDLYDKIEHADFEQLKELYGLITNYFNGTEAVEDWELLSESQKNKINQSLEQADAGLGTPAKEAIKKVREQYGLNG
jgi:hypothetical protein